MATQNDLLSAAGHTRWRPHDILEDSSLSITEKIRLLESLELDLQQLERATEENMPPSGNREGDEVTERLRQVSSVLTLLRH